MSLNNLRVVAFDWDNTLSLNRDALVKSINEVLAEYGMPQWDIIKTKRNSDLSFKDNFPLIFGNDHIEAYKKYCRYYTYYAPRIVQSPVGAIELLSFFRENNIKTVIVTNKDRLLLDFELPLLYDKRLFDNIVCGHEASRDKPNPEQLQFAVKNWVEDITSDNVWMIGDSAMDSKCALAAGARAVRIGQSIWNDVENKDERIAYFADFSSLQKAIKELMNA